MKVTNLFQDITERFISSVAQIDADTEDGYLLAWIPFTNINNQTVNFGDCYLPAEKNVGDYFTS